MATQIEIFISIDNDNFYKLDLDKSESINMKNVLKDTTDLSKVFSPFSQSFTIPATLNNQKVFGYVGMIKVLKTKTDNVFSCKIYNNGLINQTGKLKITDVTEENGRITSYTANFTTTMLSLASRMGDDLIGDLPDNPVTINWTPNEVYNSLSSIKQSIIEPMEGVKTKYYVPLISNIRVYQLQQNIALDYIDNVAYNPSASPTGTHVLKSDELSPAVNGKSIIDMIRKKYNLDIVMPIEQEQYYNDWYIYCNGEQKEEDVQSSEYNVINDFGDLVLAGGSNTHLIPLPRKYYISADKNTNFFDIVKNISGAGYSQFATLVFILYGVTSTKINGDVNIVFILQLEDGSIYDQVSSSIDGNGNVEVLFFIPDGDFVLSHFKFKILQKSNTPVIWKTSLINMYYNYQTIVSATPINGIFEQGSFNDNSFSMGGTRINLYKSIPETKCVDFLNSFLKTFNISIFDASPNDDRLYWLTPNDLLSENKEYSKRVVNYTPYIVSKKVQKKIPNDYNFYNFKHKTSKYKSNSDYLKARGYEFGQLTYPENKPTENLSEFKVETGFSIIEAIPIAGMPDEFTSYGFTDEAPEIWDTGEKRYKPNTSELTIFFACGLRNLSRRKRLGFQGTSGLNILSVLPLNSYIKTSPVHTSGFSFGFGLIQEATTKSLYYYFYRNQTERLLDPNTLQHAFELKLPAKEMVLNFANTAQGESNIPTGFRLQNEIILQETRFSIIDASIDITTGNTKFNLLNF